MGGKRLKNLILKNEEDIRNNRKVKALVDQYKQLREETSKFYTDVSNWGEKMNSNQLILKIALQHIEPANPPPDKEQYMKCMEKLREFKAAQNLLDKDLSDLLDSTCLQHEQIWEKLEVERKKSDAKLKCKKAWRKFSYFFFAVALVMVFVSSMAAAHMTAPPLEAVFATQLPIGTTGEWLNYLLEKKEKKIEVENDVLKTMQNRTYGGLCELKQISARVKRLEGIIRTIVESIDLYCKDEDNQQVAVQDIREKLQVVEDRIDNLKNPLEHLRKKRQSAEDAVEDMKKQTQSWDCRGLRSSQWERTHISRGSCRAVKTEFQTEDAQHKSKNTNGNNINVIPPILNYKSEPPTLFDGATRLYIIFTCSFAQHTWLARNHKGFYDIQLITIDLHEKLAWYKEKVYPPGSVPSLEHNAKVTGESLDFLEYI
ncbi:hypothetical protein SUGI_0437830 [Cryptomeria japonica]|nr:hypothetical protein SUGI_0437830 [Cryptomeria japonica]